MKQDEIGLTAECALFFLTYQRQAEVNLKTGKFKFVQVPENPAFAVWKGVSFY